MNMRRGPAEGMTRVRAHDRMNATMRQAVHVVRCWMIIQEANDVAMRTSSVSL